MPLGIAAARKNKSVDKFLVHKIDRFARNSMDFAILRSRLRSKNVDLVSIVEQFEDTPLGHFMEQVMASLAEFFSANLSLEVKKGLDEKLRRGEWCWMPPIGYVRRGGEIAVDGIRATFIQSAFGRFSTGTISSSQLAEELYLQGFRGLHDQKLDASKICRILHDPFYVGRMRTGDRDLPGKHDALISREIFDQVQAIFKQRPTGGRHANHHDFPLARKLPCPKCGMKLVGEQHRKPTGRIYKYYRCHTKACGTTFTAEQAKKELITTSPILLSPPHAPKKSP